MSSSRISTDTPDGCRLVPPPGWTHIPLRHNTEESIKAIVDKSIRTLSDIPKDDLIKARMELTRRLRKVAAQAQEAGGITLYIPVEKLYGAYIGASFVISRVASGLGANEPTDSTVSKLLTDNNNEELALDGVNGIRADYVVQPNPDGEIEFPSRRIDYVVPIPLSQPQAWITVCFSTIADGQPHSEFSEVLVELFDAVMTTFRWSYA